MKKTALAVFVLTLMSASVNAYAQQTMGKVTGVIDGEQINVQVRCEYADPPGFINARSGWESFSQSDTDGDGIFISVGAMKAVGRKAVIFHAGETIYKFGQKGDFDQTDLSISDEFTRKDGSKYNAQLDLGCGI